MIASNPCHDLLMMSANVSNIAILKIKNTDYRSVIAGFSKSEYKKTNIKSNFEAMNLLETLI